MKSFTYYKVNTVSQAVSLLERHGDKAALLGGGSDCSGSHMPENPFPVMPLRSLRQAAFDARRFQN